MSCRGPRPQCSPLAVSSHSITPLAPSVMVTCPSSPWAAEGMKMPMERLSAASTSGCRTIWGKCGEPISSSPSATSTKFTGGERSEEHTSELQSQSNLVCRLLLEKKKKNIETTLKTDERRAHSPERTIPSPLGPEQQLETVYATLREQSLQPRRRPPIAHDIPSAH